MKKLLTVFACIGLLFSLSACSGSKVEDAALDQLETSIKKFGEVESFHYSFGVDMSKQNSKVEVNGTFLSEGPQMSMVVDMKANGLTMDKFMEMYLKDGMTYISTMGTNMKQDAGMDSFAGVSFDWDDFNMDKEELKENLEEATLSGDKLHLVIKDDLIKESMKAQTTNLTAAGLEEVTGMAMDIELENDFVKTATITLSGKDTKGNSATFEIYMNLNDINSAKDIAFPEGMEDWPLSDGSTDFLE